MPPSLGIDTSVLVRLTSRQPERDFEYCVQQLRILVEEQGIGVFASNQVVGEAYIALMHHYGVSDSEARSSLIDALTSGLAAPLNGQSVIEALQSRGGAGLMDRLIDNGYHSAGLEVLTLDRRMSRLPNSRLL